MTDFYTEMKYDHRAINPAWIVAAIKGPGSHGRYADLFRFLPNFGKEPFGEDLALGPQLEGSYIGELARYLLVRKSAIDTEQVKKHLPELQRNLLGNFMPFSDLVKGNKGVMLMFQRWASIYGYPEAFDSEGAWLSSLSQDFSGNVTSYGIMFLKWLIVRNPSGFLAFHEHPLKDEVRVGLAQALKELQAAGFQFLGSDNEDCLRGLLRLQNLIGAEQLRSFDKPETMFVVRERATGSDFSRFQNSELLRAIADGLRVGAIEEAGRRRLSPYISLSEADQEAFVEAFLGSFGLVPIEVGVRSKDKIVRYVAWQQSKELLLKLPGDDKPEEKPLWPLLSGLASNRRPLPDRPSYKEVAAWISK